MNIDKEPSAFWAGFREFWSDMMSRGAGYAFAASCVTFAVAVAAIAIAVLVDYLT